MSDQKYRQRGYRDDDNDRGESRAQRQQSPPPPRNEGPRGRGLGSPTSSAFRCSDCGRRVAAANGIELEQVCPGCNSDLHACVNCTQFDPSARFQCRQPVEVTVAKKRKRNECKLFTPKLVMEFEADSGARSPEEARAAFDDLFSNL